MKNKKNLDYYLNLPWSYTIETESHKGKTYYVIYVNELPGICTDSEDLSQGMEEIKDAIACVVEVYQKKGEPIPEPIDRSHYKGKISYRTDCERHSRIARVAKMKKKSISKILDSLVDVGLQHLNLVNF